MRVVKSVAVEDFEFRGSIKDSDVSRLVRAFAEDPHINEAEAETLLRLNKTCPVQGPSWSVFLVDAIADYILNQSGHEGYITTEKSRWLVGAEGQAETGAAGAGAEEKSRQDTQNPDHAAA